MAQCGLTVIEPLVLNHSNHLRVLDLSRNYLDSSALHRFLDTSSVFTYIDFSGNGIQGRIPDALGNSTSLSHLDLSYNQLHGELSRPLKNSLTYLDMSSNNFNVDLPRLFTGLRNATRLKHIAFSNNLLTGSFPNISRFLVLTRLSLRSNGLSGPLVEGNLMLPNLEALDLSENRFTGEFPGNLSLPNLKSLDLSNNKFTGRLANLSSCPSLLELAISNNAFTGSLIGSIQHIFKIEWLDAGYNKFEDMITEAHLSSLPRLRGLDLSFNLNITMRINHSWIHAVRFDVLKLANCKLGPNFPKWLKKHNQLKLLDVSNSGIFDSIPAWFWGNVYNCLQLNMSNNRIYGTLPDLSSKLYALEVLDLSSNEFTGLLPNLSAVFSVDLSRNKFSGPILDFCRSQRMFNFLDLSSNLLSGEIPQECFVKLLSIDYLNLANNNLSWEISTAGNFKCYVSSLHLRNNSFKGEIPRSLLNCSRLKILDLGENELSGEVHKWLATSMSYLSILILKSNKIYGSLPSSICHLASIQVLDISSNKISGTIPKCINNFTRLGLQEDTTGSWVDMFSIQRRIDSAEYFRDSASVIWKGNEETYINTLGLVKMIDLSGNELTGVIPHGITSLHGLLGLNLSRNNLVGPIPRDIDRMKLLNFLDLSGNNLSGGIPPTLSKLSHLGILKLSFNNLSGRIPWDTHMQTFGASAYSRNPELCGPPLLSRPCPNEDHEKQDDDDEEEEERLITRGFYISMLIGFGVAFWVVFWTLFFNKRWNSSIMRIYFVVADWLYVIVLVNKRRLLSYLGNA